MHVKPPTYEHSIDPELVKDLLRLLAQYVNTNKSLYAMAGSIAAVAAVLKILCLKTGLEVEEVLSLVVIDDDWVEAINVD